MPLTDLLLAQVSDPLRIGLLVGLFITMLRTRAVTGQVLPLAAGIVFVAVLLPVTAPGLATHQRLEAIAVGIGTNCAVVLLIFLVWWLYQRVRP